MATQKKKVSKATKDRAKPGDKHTKASWKKRDKSREGKQQAFVVAAKAAADAAELAALEAAEKDIAIAQANDQALLDALDVEQRRSDAEPYSGTSL